MIDIEKNFNYLLNDWNKVAQIGPEDFDNDYLWLDLEDFANRYDAYYHYYYDMYDYLKNRGGNPPTIAINDLIKEYIKTKK